MRSLEFEKDTGKTYDEIYTKVREVAPETVVADFEIAAAAPLVAEIRRLKREKNAVVLGHNYMSMILDATIPDFRGDSLELARKATETEADILVMCGVGFMAETLKIRNPKKKVLIPSLEAGCSLAQGIKAEDVRWLKSAFPGLPVVTYINTYADVKAETDVCCTSGNVQKVVRWAQKKFGTKSVIFIPDKYMAGNVASELGMRTFFPNRSMEDPASLVDFRNEEVIIGWNARCYVHEQYRPEHVEQVVKAYPDAKLIIHPEVPPETMERGLKYGAVSGSTSSMIKQAEQLPAGSRAVFFTECSLADNAISRRPDLRDKLIRFCNMTCKYMKTITLEDTRDALLYEQYEIKIPEKIRQRAELAVRRMLEIGRI